MTAPTTTPFNAGADFFERLEEFHGHRCPMSILGARLGLAGCELYGRHGETTDVEAIYYHRTCAIDGIQMALGTTLGNGNIELVEVGEHRLEVRRRGEPVGAIFELTQTALTLGRAYSELRTKRSGLNPGTDETVDTDRLMEAILKKLETMPTIEIVGRYGEG